MAGGLSGGYHWLANLGQNPIFRREKGAIGSRANPYYNQARKLSPFIILGAIYLSLCGSYNHIVFLASRLGGGDSLPFFYGAIPLLTCSTAFLMGIITLYGVIMAPAVTAPAISRERERQTWDLLRLTPYSTRSLILAKLLGSLARLPIWALLLLLSLLQLGLILFDLFANPSWSGLAWNALALTRPWLEIFFAASLALFMSVQMRSTTMALVGSYTGLLLFKLVSNNFSWIFLLGLLQPPMSLQLLGANLAAAATLLIAALFFLLLTSRLVD